MLAAARRRPDAFFIGIDAVAEAMGETSRRASMKPARGGAPNVMFLCAAAEALPGPLAGVFDEITVNYPWGSLLRAVAAPDEAVLAGIAATGKPGARVTMLVNAHPLRDAAQARAMKLEGCALVHDPAELAQRYAPAGLDHLVIDRSPPGLTAETTWAKRLAASAREIWRIEARVAG